MKNLIPMFIMLIAFSASAQKMQIAKGSLQSLKGVQSVQVQFTYDHMNVGDGTEEFYLKRRSTEMNSKEAGRGDAWAKAWVNDRQARFEPKFLELFQEHSKMSVVADAKYILIFHTIFTEPGFNVGVAHRSARISAEVSLVDAANPSNVLTQVTITNSPGRGAGGFDYDTGYRIQEAYAKAGKSLGKFIVHSNK
jgi:hypothetical protein